MATVVLNFTKSHEIKSNFDTDMSTKQNNILHKYKFEALNKFFSVKNIFMSPFAVITEHQNGHHWLNLA